MIMLNAQVLPLISPISIRVIFFLFNAVGLPTYPSLYDQFLIVVGLVFNVVIVWMAWRWKEQEL